MFRKLFVMVAFALCAGTAFASQATVDVSGLSEAQIAELKAHAANAVAQAAKGLEAPAPKDVGVGLTLAATWGTQAAQAAEGFAKALGIAARELGVTVNDFLHTDAGKLTAILIIWKIAGTAAVKMLYGLVFISIGLTLVRTIYMRLFTKEYVKVPYSRFWGMFTGEKLVRVSKSFQELHNDGEWLAFWVMMILSIAILVSGGGFFVL